MADLPRTRTWNLWFRRPTRYPEDGSEELPVQVCGGKFTIAPADLFSLNNKSFPILTILTFYAQKHPAMPPSRIRGVHVSLLRRKLHWLCTLCVDTVVTRAHTPAHSHNVRGRFRACMRAHTSNLSDLARGAQATTHRQRSQHLGSKKNHQSRLRRRCACQSQARR
jgi:hypothetical protein